MKKIIVTAAVLILGCGMAGSAVAAEDMQAAPGEATETTTLKHFKKGEIICHPATRLLGKDVQGTDGTRLGEVNEIMIDARRGQAAYLVVAPDPALGIGEEGRLVPWTALRTEPETGDLVADIKADKFKEAPKVATEIADQERAEEIHQFYGVAPYWQVPESRLEELPEEEGQVELIPQPTPLWWE